MYNTKTGVLTERKSLIKHIHIGYRYQLYAEMFGLLELGYKVNKLQLHSLQDNKKYPIPLPNQQRIQEFTSTIQDLQNFDPISILQNNHTSPNTNISIYQNLSF
ncbi:MAG: type V CRISPR-associated protein Cas4 [Thermales bacterium]|nr:type V CRISPR-associated protein Cas4 [Thermales bacterium]